MTIVALRQAQNDVSTGSLRCLERHGDVWQARLAALGVNAMLSRALSVADAGALGSLRADVQQYSLPEEAQCLMAILLMVMCSRSDVDMQAQATMWLCLTRWMAHRTSTPASPLDQSLASMHLQKSALLMTWTTPKR